MKKLFRNTALFLAPLVVLLYFLPVQRRLKYQGLKDDCFNHGIWIHDRIFEHQTPIDLAFLGSSHTINGIDDKTLSDSLKIKVANLGYCRLGINLSYVLLQELLQGKKIKTLVLEIRETEDRYSHPVFPHLASSSEVLFPHPFFNRDLGSDIWMHFSYKIELTQEYLYSQKKAAFQSQSWGYAPHEDTANREILFKIKEERQANDKHLSSFAYRFYNAYPESYLKDVYQLCQEQQIELLFLYSPAFGAREKRPSGYDLYRKYGQVLLPPQALLDDPNHWHDENHLNRAGGQKLSAWLVKQLKKSIE